MYTCPEREINNSAVLFGFVADATTGLGYLVLTWTTVVLLGGFVSVLERKDFWSLTIITLVEIAWISDQSGNDRMSNIADFIIVMGDSMEFIDVDKRLSSIFLILTRILLVFSVSIPLVVFYLFGLFISTALSLWRLIQRDYIYALDTDPNKKNLTPALNVLYSLALFQGGIYFCRFLYFYSRPGAKINSVVRRYGLDQAVREVTDYYRVTRKGVEKDMSFVTDWNLLTYAVGLLESRSPQNYRSGAKLLDSLLPKLKSEHSEKQHKDPEDPEDEEQQIFDMDPRTQLQLALSSDNVVRKLLFTLDMTRPFGEEARGHAAGILVYLAAEVRVDQFPQGLSRVGSLLQDDGTELKKKGLKILMLLCGDKDNRRAVISEPSLLLKIMATANIQGHKSIGDDREEHHRRWEKVAVPTLRLLQGLVDSGAKLPPHQGSIKAIKEGAMEIFTQCNMCDGDLKKTAIKVLESLPMDDHEAPSCTADDDDGIFHPQFLKKVFMQDVVEISNEQTPVASV